MSQTSVHTATKTDLIRVYARMKKDFMPFERMRYSKILRAIKKGTQECLIFERDGAMAGYAIVCIQSVHGYALLTFFAVDKAMRGRGQGSEILRLLFDRYAHKKGLVIELTRAPWEEEDFQKRLRFYTRAGFVLIQSHYRLGGQPAELMVRPLLGGSGAEFQAIAHLAMPEIYLQTLSKRALDKYIEIQPVAAAAPGKEGFH